MDLRNWVNQENLREGGGVMERFAPNLKLSETAAVDSKSL